MSWQQRIPSTVLADADRSPVAPSRDRDSMLTVRLGPDLVNDAVVLSASEYDDQARRRGEIGCGHWRASWRGLSQCVGAAYLTVMNLPAIFAMSCPRTAAGSSSRRRRKARIVGR